MALAEQSQAMADKTWLSLMAQRCQQNRITVRPKIPYSSYLTDAFGCPASEVLARMYEEEDMSVADIQSWLTTNVGWCVSERQVNVMLRNGGIALRNYSERRRVAWRTGKMDACMAKARLNSKHVYFIGSTTEKTVRYLLQVSLSALKLRWHVIIGDCIQLILERYEVDIPIVVIEPSTGLSCRFALEVDSSFVHGSADAQQRDRAKDESLGQAGWKVYRLNGDSQSPLHIVPQVVDIAVDIKRVCGERFTAQEENSRTDWQQSALPSGGL